MTRQMNKGLVFILIIVLSIIDGLYAYPAAGQIIKKSESTIIPDNTVRIHYLRADENYDNWGLWLWNDVAVPSEASGTWPMGASAFTNTKVDEYGAYVDVKLKDNPSIINFIVVNRSTGEKDSDTKGFTQFDKYKELFIKEGDDIVSTSPDGSKLEESKAHFPSWSKNATVYEVNVRQYTPEGTFKAFSAHLPRLKAMGVKVLWFMPIYPISKEGRIGSLGSPYAIQNYKKVNPDLGNMADFKKLVIRAHDMGFKVMLDWVGNHTGMDNIWIKNKEWYTLDKEGEISHPPGTNWLDVADLNYSNSNMREAMLNAMKFWVKEADIDGYRADYAAGVPVGFWETARKEIEKIKPIYMLAEDNTAYNLLDDAFNSNYGWDLNHIMREIAAGNKDGKDIKSYTEKLRRIYPIGSYPMHWTSNHDDNSWEGTTSELFGESEKLMAALTFTLPGMPLIYSGQEAGLDKRLAFFDKDEIPWSNFSMYKYYQDLVRLKTKNEALWNGKDGGEIRFLETSNQKILAFERSKGSSKVIVVLNLSANIVSGDVKIPQKSEGRYSLFSSNESIRLDEQHQFNFEPWSYQIMTR